MLTSMLSALAPAIESLLGWAPALVGGLSVAVWVVWALGSVLLIVVGMLLSGVIALLGRGVSGRSNRSMAFERPA